MYNNSYYGNFRNLSFSDIWPDSDTFVNEYKDSGLYEPAVEATQSTPAIPPLLTDKSLQTLFCLLYSEYGNSVSASSDINQFKYQIFSTIFEYGPSWEKKLDIQKKLRNLSLEELKQGSKAIYNKALNPGISPSTSSLNELTYINEQNTTNFKRSDLEAYTALYELIETDVTKEFITKFKKYFLQIVLPEKPLWYYSEDYNEEND